MRLALILLSFAFAGVILFAAAPSASAMTFETTNRPQACRLKGCIVASGDIDADSGKALTRFVLERRVQPGATVILRSDGGNVLGGLELGAEIRKAGLGTTVALYDAASGELKAGGSCASACAYAFVGGVERSIGAGSKLGVHQVAGPPEKPWDLSATDSQWLMSLVAAHLNHMGVAMDVMVLALRTSPQDMHWLSSTELARYAVTNTANA